MISAYTVRKTTAALISFVAATCCFAGSASAQSIIAAQTPLMPMPPLPDELLRSSGKWIGKRSFDDLPSGKPQARGVESAPLYFKPATPGWIGVLDTASYIIGGVGGIGPADNIGVSGKLYGRSPRLDNPAGPSN